MSYEDQSFNMYTPDAEYVKAREDYEVAVSMGDFCTQFYLERTYGINFDFNARQHIQADLRDA